MNKGGGNSNIAWVRGNVVATGPDSGGFLRPYIELDLGSVQTVDSMMLWGLPKQLPGMGYWGLPDYSVVSKNLRVCLSETSFYSMGMQEIDEFNKLAMNTSVAKFDVAQAGAAPIPTSSTAGIDKLISTEDLVGTAYNDKLTGDNNANRLAGGKGADTVNGGGGDDVFVQDTDQVGDILDGGPGNDTVDYSATAQQAGVNVSLDSGSAFNFAASGAASMDKLTNFENVTASLLNDIVTGDSGANRLAGLSGDDRLVGSAGNDTFDGGLGRDMAYYGSLGVGSSINANLAAGRVDKTVAAMPGTAVNIGAWGRYIRISTRLRAIHPGCRWRNWRCFPAGSMWPPASPAQWAPLAASSKRPITIRWP